MGTNCCWHAEATVWHTTPAPGPLARLDRIPVWPYERKLLWVVGAGYFFAFFDIVTISFAAPVIATQSTSPSRR
jgi:hypothetical protein